MRASRIIVVKQAFSLADVLDSVEDDSGYAPGKFPHSCYIGLAGSLAVVDAVDESSHIGVLLRSNDKGLIRIEAASEFHYAVVLAQTLQFDTLAQSHHFSYVLANQRLFFDIPIRHYVVAHSLFVYEIEWTHRLFLVFFINLVLIEGHVIQSEV